MSEEPKKPSLASRAGGAFGKVKKRVIPVRNVVIQKKSQAISSIKREASNYAAARREEERIKQERARHVRGIVREENRVAEEAYLQGRRKGIQQSYYQAGRAGASAYRPRAAPRKPAYSVPSYSLMGDLGILAPSPSPKGKPGKKKAAVQAQRPSMLNGLQIGGGESELLGYMGPRKQKEGLWL